MGYGKTRKQIKAVGEVKLKKRGHYGRKGYQMGGLDIFLKDNHNLLFARAIAQLSLEWMPCRIMKL